MAILKPEMFEKAPKNIGYIVMLVFYDFDGSTIIPHEGALIKTGLNKVLATREEADRKRNKLEYHDWASTIENRELEDWISTIHEYDYLYGYREALHAEGLSDNPSDWELDNFNQKQIDYVTELMCELFPLYQVVTVELPSKDERH